MKEVYECLTIDVIAKCAFGIEVNSVKPSGLDKSSKFYKAVVGTFSAFCMTNRWMSYIFLVFFNLFPEAAPVRFIFPEKIFDCKFMLLLSKQQFMNKALLRNLSFNKNYFIRNIFRHQRHN